MIKKVIKMISLILTLSMFAGLLAGCGKSNTSDSTSSGGEQVTIKFVQKFPEEARMTYFNEIVAEFEKQNPNIKIEMTAYGDEEIKDKTRVLLGSDDAPDIFFTWSGERITQYVDSGNALDITKYLNDDADWKNHFNQTMLETTNKNGSYWGIPWDYSSKEMIYNKKIFSELGLEVPKTWSEFLDVCQKIKDDGKYTPIAVGNQYSWVVAHYLTTLNGKLVPKDTIQKNYTMQDVEYTDPGYAQALDMVNELYTKGYTNNDINSMTWEMSQAMVQEGKAAMIYEEVQNLVNYNKALGDDWGYFDFPEVEGAKGEA
ncbi:MAG: extracellular solute-binding protein, partial [Herbinix sp.]|nr:extracellular solute-binding protein [Herbinix sp.]